MLFSLGQTVCTRGALDWAVENGVNLTSLLARHVTGDWGDLGKEDQQLNWEALAKEGRLFSSYHLKGEKLYVITEWDRSVTTILLANEY